MDLDVPYDKLVDLGETLILSVETTWEGMKAMKHGKGELTNVPIPIELYEKIKQRIKDTGFTTVSSYVTYVLKEVLTEDKGRGKSFTEEDEEKIKARLKALGYIE